MCCVREQKGYLPFGEAVQEVGPVVAEGHCPERGRSDHQDGKEGSHSVADRCHPP